MRSGCVRHWIIGFLLLTASAVLSACAARSHLIVDYKVPTASTRISGQMVYIQIKDARTETQILTPAAARHFKNFNDLYRLTLISDKESVPVGGRDLQGIFLEAFKKRMERMGAKIAPAERDNVPMFQVVIKSLRIDLQEHKWIANASYEANLFLDHQLVARETVSGEAERTRIIGSEGIDETLSDIFSAIINRLDIGKFFQQAKLI